LAFLAFSLARKEISVVADVVRAMTTPVTAARFTDTSSRSRDLCQS